MNLLELEQKRDYANSLRTFSEEELKELEHHIVKINISNYKNKQERKGLIGALEFIRFLITEESSFPYPPNYHHPLTEDILKLLNFKILEHQRILLPCEKGNYRIGENDKLGNASLPSKRIFITRLKKLIRWYNTTDYDYLTKTAIFHYLFLHTIHPFYDGNGRTARMFMNLELARKNYPMIGLKNNDSDAYYETFTLPQEEGIEHLKRLIYKNIDQELDLHISLKSL